MEWNLHERKTGLAIIWMDAEPEEAAAFEAHAATCAKCAKLVAEVRGLVTRMQKLEPLAAPPMLVTRIVNATSGPQNSRRDGRMWWRGVRRYCSRDSRWGW